MAAITVSPSRGWNALIRAATAQADTGQTDWISVPAQARFCTVVFNLTAAAGTTPVTNLTIKGLYDPGRDDANAFHLTGTTLTAQNTTATSGLVQVVDIGPGLTTDLILGATGVNFAALGCPLPPLMGIGLVFDRGSANETYTYTLTARFS